MDALTPFGAQANERILTILGQVPLETAAIAAYERAAGTLVTLWDSDRNDSDRQKRPHERNFFAEARLSAMMQEFLLRTSATAASAVLQPFFDAVDRHPREIGAIIEGLIFAEDRQPNTEQFWSLWQRFAGKVPVAKWLPYIDREHATGSEVISAIFLGVSWKDETRHWRSLDGHAHLVHGLVEDMPPSSRVLASYLRFVYHVGEQSLPRAFIRVAKRLQDGNACELMHGANSAFVLEALLQRYVYRRPLELKREADLRDSVLFLLDVLVENGSSAAFRMRDDFVTPASGLQGSSQTPR
jgi:hypothetical protein